MAPRCRRRWWLFLTPVPFRKEERESVELAEEVADCAVCSARVGNIIR